VYLGSISKTHTPLFISMAHELLIKEEVAFPSNIYHIKMSGVLHEMAIVLLRHSTLAQVPC